MEVDSSERSDIDADTEVKITAFINLCIRDELQKKNRHI